MSTTATLMVFGFLFAVLYVVAMIVMANRRDAKEIAKSRSYGESEAKNVSTGLPLIEITREEVPALSRKIIQFYAEKHSIKCGFSAQTDAGQCIVVTLIPPPMVSSIKSLFDTENMNLYLGVDGISISKSGKLLMIEVPKKRNSPLSLYRVFRMQRPSREQFVIGMERTGVIATLSLNKETPHCVIQGQTGSGKTIATRTILANILITYKNDPLSGRILIYDPKCDIDNPDIQSLSFARGAMITDTLTSNADVFSERLVSLCNELRSGKYSYNGVTFVVIDETADIINHAGGDCLNYIAQIGRGYKVFLVWATGGITNAYTGGLKYLQTAVQNNLYLGQSNKYANRAQGGQTTARGKGDAAYIRASGEVKIQIATLDDDLERAIIQWNQSGKQTAQKPALAVTQDNHAVANHGVQPVEDQWNSIHPLTLSFFNSLALGDQVSIAKLREWYHQNGIQNSSALYQRAREQWNLAISMFIIERENDRVPGIFRGAASSTKRHSAARWFGRDRP